MFDFKDELENIKGAGLYRKLLNIGSQSAPRVIVEGREMLMMASSDYLGLCSHPRIKKLASEAIQQWGAGAGAARLISGNVSLFSDLEEKLAAFKGTEDALVFSTGYMANAGLLTALAGKEDAVYSDALNHASIIDGCRLSRARVMVYPHRDVAALEAMLKKGAAYKRMVVVTDGVFSMDGDIAPLPELAALARKYDAALIVDDAHGTGVLGERGSGALEHFGLSGDPDIIVMGTMGKAMGSFGAFAAGSRELKNYLINRSRSFIFTTALPPSVIAASCEALRIIEAEPERRQQLTKNCGRMREGLKKIGFNTLGSETQIVPVMIGDVSTAFAAAGRIIEEGLFALAIRPPTVPEGTSRLRLTLMATHTEADIDEALSILEKVGREFRII